MTHAEEKPAYHKTQGIFGDTTVGVVLPKRFAESLGISKGDYLRIIQEGRKIIVEKAETAYESGREPDALTEGHNHVPKTKNLQ